MQNECEKNSLVIRFFVAFLFEFWFPSAFLGCFESQWMKGPTEPLWIASKHLMKSNTVAYFLAQFPFQPKMLLRFDWFVWTLFQFTSFMRLFRVNWALKTVGQDNSNGRLIEFHLPFCDSIPMTQRPNVSLLTKFNIFLFFDLKNYAICLRLRLIFNRPQWILDTMLFVCHWRNLWLISII